MNLPYPQNSCTIFQFKENTNCRRFHRFLPVVDFNIIILVRRRRLLLLYHHILRCRQLYLHHLICLSPSLVLLSPSLVVVADSLSAIFSPSSFSVLIYQKRRLRLEEDLEAETIAKTLIANYQIFYNNFLINIINFLDFH